MQFPFPTSRDLRERIFQWLLLIAGITLVFVVTPINLVEHLPAKLNAGILPAGLLTFAMLYLAVWRGIFLYRTLGLLLLALQHFTWLYNNGSQGPTPLVTFIAVLVFCVLFQGAERILFLTLYALDLYALYYAEYLHPTLVAPYRDPLLRVQDTTISIPFAIMIGALIMEAVLRAYEAEKLHLVETNAKLEAALAETRMLRGLLPICAACKKIRDTKNQWIPMEAYISAHSQASFTHGLCPQCLQVYEADVTASLPKPPPA